MAGIISPVVCEQRPEATHIFSRAKLEEVIKHWEFKYELLDKYAKDLAVKNKHWEVSWSYHQNMVITRIEQREAVIKGLTQSHQLLVQNNAGFVRAESGWQEVINQKDSEIMDLKQEKESLSHSASVSTNWQEKYNALKEESSKRLEKKKATNVESVEKDNKSLAERIRKDTAEKKEGWASLSKLIKEKFQKIEDKKSHLEEMSTKLLAVKQEILEEEVKVENNGETVMVPEVRKMEDQIKNPEDKSIEDLAETLHSQAAEDTLMKEDQEEKFTEDESTQEVVQTPEVEDEEQSTPEVVETPEMEDEQSTQEVVETPEMEDEQSTQEVVEIPEVEDEKKEPEEFPDFPKTEAAEVELQTEESGEEIQLSLVAAVAIKDQSCETTEVEDEKKEPEEFFSLKKSGEVALQKEKRRKKKKQQRKRVQDIKLDGKFSEAQAEKQLSLDEELIEPQEESINDLVVETPNCWEINFTPMWKVKPTEDKLANKDHICDTPEEEEEEEEKEPEESPDLTQTEAGEAGLQEMESGEETKLSWAAVVANKYKSSKTREKKVEELEEVSDLKQTEAGEEMLQKEKNRNKKKHERRREKALKAMEIIVNEMDSLANIVQSCETSEATDEKKEVEEFPDLPKTEAGPVGLQKLESGEENKRSRAAVLKDQSCYTKEKKVEEEVKEPEEASDPKKTEAQEEVLLKEEQVKDPEEASVPKQTPVEGKLRVGKKSKKDKKKEKKREEYNRSHC
ncbi:golgin subfamily A member 6-like protein 22 [Pseudochaenichthys georgianus]|uniref:golgin subfamily A member 6-like protein 22 n=1 Tax=Pseudochaenichthys georgianus TaxID=52239 RepID=UPI0039C2F1EE